MKDRPSIIVDIANEAVRAEETHRHFPVEHIRSLAILNEEALEVTRATLRLSREGDYLESLKELKDEVVQVGAVAVLWLERIHEEIDLNER